MPLFRGRPILLLGRTAIGFWIVLGLVHSAVVLARPGRGWLWGWEPEIERVLGTPRDHEDASGLVSDALTLIEPLAPDAPVWIVRTPRLEEDTWQYIQMQLAHLLYPRGVWVFAANDAEQTGLSYPFAVTFGDDTPGPGWQEIGRTRRAVLHRPVSP